MKQESTSRVQQLCCHPHQKEVARRSTGEVRGQRSAASSQKERPEGAGVSEPERSEVNALGGALRGQRSMLWPELQRSEVNTLGGALSGQRSTLWAGL
ncbi:unnamed protein product [Gadus morhua 'NCC']